MSILTIIFFLFHLGAAQVSLHERRHATVGKHVVLNSRGDASIEHRGEPQTDGTGETHTGGTPPQTDVNGVEEFVQRVNGSTPTGMVRVGTPPKDLLAIFDTGSDRLVCKTWTTMKDELPSFDGSALEMLMPQYWVYDDDTSATYRHSTRWDNETKEWVPKKELISYGSGQAKVVDGEDTLHLGNHSFVLENMSIAEIEADSLQLLHTEDGIDAVMGLQHMKNRSLGHSVFSLARDKNLFSSFGYCYDPRGRASSNDTSKLDGENGTFIWGDKATEGQQLDVVGDMHWAVKLGSMRVLGGTPSSNSTEEDNDTSTEAEVKNKFKDVQFIKDEPDIIRQEGEDSQRTRGTFGGDGDLTPHHEEMQQDAMEVVTKAEAACANHSCCGILDTGSNIIAGPTALMKEMADQLNVDPFCKNYDHLPKIELIFGGMKVNISKEGYVMRVPVPKWAGNGDDAGGGGDGLQLDKDKASSDEDDELGYAPSAASRRWSLSQVDGDRSRLTSKRKWKYVFDRLYKERKVDFRPIMSNFLENDNHTDAPKTMCMPAIVPLDMHTKFGPLFIVGTPLLTTHYARWSHPQGATHPTIHLKKLEDTDRCKRVHGTELLEAGTPRFIRSESKGTASAAHSESPSLGPAFRHLDDIKFPHWARGITEI